MGVDRKLCPMSDRMSPEEVERVLRRAAELQAGEADGSSGLDVESVVAAASEAGISPRAVRTAIAVEKLGGPTDPSALDRLLGVGTVVVQRGVDMDPATAMSRIDRWLTTGHYLQRVHLDEETGRWRRRHDWAARIQRRIRGLTGGAALGEVEGIVAKVAPVDHHRSLVQVRAGRARSRSSSLGVFLGTGGFAVGATAMAVVVNPLVGLLAVLGVLVAGSVARRSRRAAAHLRAELELFLGQVEAGALPTSVGPRSSRRTRRNSRWTRMGDEWS